MFFSELIFICIHIYRKIILIHLQTKKQTQTIAITTEHKHRNNNTIKRPLYMDNEHIYIYFFYTIINLFICLIKRTTSNAQSAEFIYYLNVYVCVSR